MSEARRKFAAFDIDGTLFRWQLFHELVFELRDFLPESTKKKLEETFAAWGAREGKWRDYEHTVLLAFEDNLADIPLQEFDAAVERVMKQSGKRLYAYTRALAQKLKAEGYFLIALSGSHQEAAERFGALYGFDLTVGTTYERAQERFSGNITSESYSNKGEKLKQLAEEYNLTFEDSWAVGDSRNDITMLSVVEHPVAFNPAEELYPVAVQNGWPIVLERKNIAYRLEKGSDGTYVLAQTDFF